MPNPGWVNVTRAVGPGPALYFGMTAFDPDLGANGGETVYFGGCAVRGPCPTNQTWTYSTSGWTNATSNRSPPPDWHGMMAYDPSLSGLFLVGGLDATGGALAQVWEYNDSGWQNLTSTSWGSGLPSGGVARSAMAWDPPLSAMVLVAGCTGSTCGRDFEAWWTINATGFHNQSNPPALHFQDMGLAYLDWPWWNADMLLFGGDTLGTGAYNTTYGLIGYNWSVLHDETPSLGAPPGMSYPLLTANGMLGAYGTFMLFGGYNMTSGVAYNETWYYTSGAEFGPGWYGGCVLNYPACPPNPPRTVGAEMATDNSLEAPFLVEGQCATGGSGGCVGVGQAYDEDVPSYPGGVVASDLGSPAYYSFSGTQSGPTAELRVDWGDGTSSNRSYDATATGGNESSAFNFTHRYPSAGTYAINFSVSDFYHDLGWISLTAVVASDLSVYTSETANATEVAAPVGFAAVLRNGTAPYSSEWDFDDGHAAAGAKVNHSFAVPGSYQVNFTGSDSGSESVHSSLPLVVYPELQSAALAGRTLVDVGVSVSFTGARTGGMGLAPSGYRWSFGDGGTALGLVAAHAYSEPGSYTAWFNVTDALGFHSQDSISLVVDPALASSVRAMTAPAVAGAPVSFVSDPSGGTPPYVYAWSFGDGASSIAPNPSHTYSAAGNYSVKLWVNDTGGGSVHSAFVLPVGAPGGPGHPRSGPGNGTTNSSVRRAAAWPPWLEAIAIGGPATAGALLAFGVWYRRRRWGSPHLRKDP